MCSTCASWIQHRIAPYIVDSGCSAKAFACMRRRMIPRAEGIVVEVGFGSGLNLPYYDPAKVAKLVGVDPDETMLGLARRRNTDVRLKLECLHAHGESIPLDDVYADTVVVAYALCTIPDPAAALTEIRRILKPGGRLIFLEHGEDDRRWRRHLQHRLNRLWGIFAAGCNLDRNPVRLLAGAGFRIVEEHRERFPLSLSLLGRHYGGTARKAAG